MVAQRRYGRFMGLAVTSGPILVAGVVWASPAQADAASYLNDLHNAGIHGDGGDGALLQVGQKLCGQVSYGASPGDLKALALQRSDARQGASGLTPEQANELVNYAIADLCPNY
jgi:hypothetical protein